ncbi:MAG: UDP-N-acetylmuramate--L-alanine ligase [Deltaproteobacteria bacterium]|nr:UDP-N-acetylmuramate--L-alanine ligase [Deltaproteobacteria bacterium]
MYKKLKIHFIGIGGIGMSGIAEILLSLGYPVSGSDIKRSSITRRLTRLGAKIHIGHNEKNVAQAEVVVVSSAIQKANPELVFAKKQGIQVIQRAEMLAEIMRLAKYGVAVAGTHGKTTTTSLLASVLHAGGYDPTVIIGGKVRSLRSNARLGKGDFMITEADESDGSFLKLFPSIAVVTNMDREHMDHYGSFQKYREAFQSFCERLPFYGVAILCGEDNETKKLSEKVDRRTILYGFNKDFEWNAEGLEYEGAKTSFDLFRYDQFIDRITINTPGRHNVLNSLATIAVAEELGVSLKKVKKGLMQFKGVGRRMEVLLKNRNITAIDDYGHHPTEIKATLFAIRRAFAGRLVVLFQPHRYTRTQDLFTDFVKAFDLADLVFITTIYAAGEKSLPGVSGKKLAEAIQEKGKVDASYLQQSEKMVNEFVGHILPGDVVLTLGAGDITKVGKKIAKELKKSFGQP